MESRRNLLGEVGILNQLSVGVASYQDVASRKLLEPFSHVFGPSGKRALEYPTHCTYIVGLVALEML